MKEIIVPDKRICYACESSETSFNGRGCANWYLNRPTDLVLCDKCYSILIEYPRDKKGKHSRLLRFKGKQILMDKPPRKGVCIKCGAWGYTHMHHFQYDDSDPLAYTIELCVSCHNKQSWKDGNFDKRWDKRRANVNRTK